jgi:hypothetical protein
MVETKRPKEPLHQPATQAEVPTMNTFTPNTEQPTQHQETEAQEDQQQDSEEEIEAVIEDEPTRQITKDTLCNTTSHTTTRHTQPKPIHLNRQSPLPRHLYK